MGLAVMSGGKFGCADGLFLTPPGDGGEDMAPGGIVGASPAGDFVETAQTAETQAARRVDTAELDTGRGKHSDQQEAVLLVAYHFNGFKGFLAADSGKHG